MATPVTLQSGDGTLTLNPIGAAPASDTGQAAIPVRIISSLGAQANRTNITWVAEFSPAATAEAMLTLTESRDGAATTTFSSKVITSGKRLRITSISIQVETTLGTSIQRAYLRMRLNTAGAVTAASPQQTIMAAQAAGTVKSIASNFDDYPDGIEYLGDGTKQIGFSLAAPDWVTAASTLTVYVSIFGFEY